MAFFLEIIMAYRSKMGKKRSRRDFSKKASRSHKKNFRPGAKRGGIRL